MKKKSLTAKKKIHNSILKYLTNQKILKIYKEFKNSLNINNIIEIITKDIEKILNNLKYLLKLNL